MVVIGLGPLGWVQGGGHETLSSLSNSKSQLHSSTYLYLAWHPTASLYKHFTTLYHTLLHLIFHTVLHLSSLHSIIPHYINVLECAEVSRSMPGSMLECTKVCWIVPEWWYGVLKYARVCRSAPECVGVFQSVLECVRVCQSVSGAGVW